MPGSSEAVPPGKSELHRLALAQACMPADSIPFAAGYIGGWPSGCGPQRRHRQHMGFEICLPHHARHDPAIEGAYSEGSWRAPPGVAINVALGRLLLDIQHR